METPSREYNNSKSVIMSSSVALDVNETFLVNIIVRVRHLMTLSIDVDKHCREEKSAMTTNT